MTELLLLGIGLLGQWFGGLALSIWILPGEERRDRHGPFLLPSPEHAGLACILGVGGTACCLFLWSVCGGLFGRFPSLALAGVGFACGGSRLFWQLRNQAALQDQSPSPFKHDRSQRAFCRLCQAVIGFMFASAMTQTLLTPQRYWDERAIFALKAAVLFEDRTVYSPDLANSRFVQGHPRYPLLLPLTEVHVYSLLGRVDDRWSKVVFPLLYLGLVLTTVGVVSRHVTKMWAWLSGVLMATIPVLVPYEYGFLSGQADAPVGCFHGVAILYLWDTLERIASRKDGLERTAIMAGLCGGLAAFTKDEGIAYLMIDGALMAVFSVMAILRSATANKSAAIADDSQSQDHRLTHRFVMATGIFVGTSAALLVPWFLYRRGLPLTTEMNYFGRLSVPVLIDRLPTLAWSAPHIQRRMFMEWREWGLQWWLMLVALIINLDRLRRPAQCLLLLDVVGAVLALCVAGMLAPVALEEHIGGSSHRFLMQIAPVATLFAVGQLAPRRSPTSGSD